MILVLVALKPSKLPSYPILSTIRDTLLTSLVCRNSPKISLTTLPWEIRRIILQYNRLEPDEVEVAICGCDSDDYILFAGQAAFTKPRERLQKMPSILAQQPLLLVSRQLRDEFLPMITTEVTLTSRNGRCNCTERLIRLISRKERAVVNSFRFGPISKDLNMDGTSFRRYWADHFLARYFDRVSEVQRELHPCGQGVLQSVVYEVGGAKDIGAPE